MIPIQALAFTYLGMLLESKPRRDQLTSFLNTVGTDAEKMMNGLTKKAGDKPNDTPELPEPTEFR